MLHLSDQGRFFMFGHATDMRKSFHGLAALVTQHMKKDVLAGDIYVFISKRRNAIKLLRFEGDGFAIFYKQLERGTFERPATGSDRDTITTTCDELIFILKGVALKKIQYRPRYSHSQPTC
jgi:transposase